MTTITRASEVEHTGLTTPPQTSTKNKAAGYVWATARIAMGWIFLWAFLDKLFGLGFSTPDKGAWINGGHPTKGFLANSATGPFESFYHSIAGATWADWLFMLGLAGLGLALITGVGIRVAAATGALLMTMMWTVALPPATNPVIDDHIILAILLIGLAVVNAGDTLGLGRFWARTSIVRRWPFLH